MAVTTGKRDDADRLDLAPRPDLTPTVSQVLRAVDEAAKAGFAKDKDLVALGERIYRGGIADRNFAACAGCHSPNGSGIPAQFPRLSGQHADYTVTQLNAFRDGSRANSVQMTQVAAKLNDKEIKAVADYIAGLR